MGTGTATSVAVFALIVWSAQSQNPAWQVRLAGGRSSSEGRVEVTTDGTWGTVCDNQFDNSDAQVVCRMLGFTTGNHYAMTDAYFGEGTGPVLLTKLGCTGGEVNLTSCSQEQVTIAACPHSRDAGVICNYTWQAEDVQVRLVGPSSSEGRVEIFHYGRWGTVCSNGWQVQDATVVCRQLGLYSGPDIEVKVSGEYGSESTTQRIQMDNVQCTGSEENIGRCRHNYPKGYTTLCGGQPAGVSCKQGGSTWQARLVGGPSTREGRLEVSVNGTWTTVCDDLFDYNDAHVACRMLGISSFSAYVVSSGYYGRGSGPVLLSRLGCAGSESNLQTCYSKTPSTDECPHSRDVAISCFSFQKENVTVRLANSSNDEGLVEVFYNEHWGLICAADYWDSDDARVVCTQLGLPSGGRTEARFYRYTGEDFSSEKIHLTYVHCNGKEENIGHCSRGYPWGFPYCNQHSDFAGVACISGENPPWQVRLVNGPASNEGRLEVSANGIWGTVCDTGFDDNDAGVICRMLNYTSNSQYSIPGSFYGNGTGPMLVTQVNCVGSESNLTMCPQKSPSIQPCSSGLTVGIFCNFGWISQNISVRLVNTTAHVGLVEVFVYGQWGKMCDWFQYWQEDDARVVCRQLGLPYGSKVEARSVSYQPTNTSGRIHYQYPHCTGTEENFGHCRMGYPWGRQVSSCSVAQAFCNAGENPPWQVRLVGGPDNREGRVEVTTDGTWGTVCDEQFDNNDASVVCTMLGYSRYSAWAVRGAYYGSGEGEVKLTQVRCRGHEGNLTFCPQDTPSNTSCPHSQDVGVVCYYTWRPVDVEVRLVNGTAKEGRVEVYRNGQWGTVCGSGWDVEDARVVCRQLGLPSGDRVEAYQYSQYGPGPSSQVIHLYDMRCSGSEYNIGHCQHPYPWGFHYCNHASDAGVACLGEHPKWRVRLVGGGNNAREGRVEVTTNSTWGTVCDDKFGDADAKVICRMLGHTQGDHYAVPGAYYGEGANPVSLTRVGCIGEETELSLCNQQTPIANECPHSRDAGVICDYTWTPESVEVRLAGGTENEGRVEVFHNGQWGTVCSTGWDEQDARVVCQQLGLPSGSGVQVKNSWPGQAGQKIHLSDVQCGGNEDNIGGCSRRYPWGVHFCSHDNDVGVACLEGKKEDICVVETCKNGLYPYGLSREDAVLENLDDVTSPAIYIDVGFPVGPNRHTNIYVGSNGIISFDSPYNPNFPKIDSYERSRLVAPFWSDVNVVGTTDSNIFYHVYRRSYNNDEMTASVLERASLDVARFQFRPGFQATWVLVATWHSVPPFATLHTWWHKDYGSVNDASDERVTFQCVLVSDGEESFALFFYKLNSFSWQPLQGRRVIIGSVGVDDSFQSTLHSLKETAYRLDKIKGNTGDHGVWIFQVGKTVNPAQACLNWYNRNKRDDLIEVYWRRLPLCPCSPLRLASDKNWGNPFSYFRHTCLRMRVRPNMRPLGKECCYVNGIFERLRPYAGSVLRYHPFYDWRQHQAEDAQARKDCCENSGSCRLFYELRPVGECADFSVYQEAELFGDPHILTLDGKSYTFNGWGEYVMLEVQGDNQSLTLQGRTSLAQTENGTVTKATVFSAFAARDSQNASLQVELDANMTGLVIYGNGIDHTTAFREQNFEYESETLTLSRENSSLVAFFSDTGLSLTITPGFKLLTLSVAAPKTLQNSTRGLLGTFNDMPEDDFLTRGGTTLPDNATEEQIFNLFGNSWRTTEAESVFSYPPRKGHADFQHPDFIPIFLDQVDPALVNQSYQVCGGRQNLACVYDFVATGSRRIASNSADSLTQAKATQLQLSKVSPELRTEQTTLKLTVGETAHLQLSGVQSDQGDLDIYALHPSPSLTVRRNGSVSFSPSSLQEETLSFYAVDSDGLTSPSLTVDVVLCSKCSGHGTCNFTDVRQTDVNDVTNSHFRLAVCVCDVGWTGMDCESDLDACAARPCSQGQNCTDLDPEAHKAQASSNPGLPASQLGYVCSGCPPGFTLADNKCQDINECNETTICDQVCINTEGSFYCACLNGFRMSATGCQDIDECQEGTSGCQQRCTNTAGNFSCSCEEGHQLQEDGKTCTATDSTRCSALQCQYGCRQNSSGSLECFCALGYRLASDAKTCQNVNECSLSPSPCSQTCTDLTPGFQCSCRAGFSLAPDQVSCLPCRDNQYGEDCAETCECSGRATDCHPVSGCVCQDGWTDQNCSTDVDECQAGPDVCGAGQQCLNTPGSFLCRCPQGYRQEGATCIDIDECSSVSLNNCSQSQICQNTEGSYLCNCQPGYHGDSCTDIDECEMGVSGCQHLCDNVPGSFNCRCHWGYELQADRKTCRKVEDVCRTMGGQGCSQGCTVMEDSTTPTCLCDDGFVLAADGRTCREIKRYTIVVTVNIPFQGNTPENRDRFASALRSHFATVLGQNVVVDVKVSEIRNGSSVVDATVLVAVDTRKTADSMAVQATLALRGMRLTVGESSGEVTALRLEGKAVTSSSSACEVLDELYCTAEETCRSLGENQAECQPSPRTVDGSDAVPVDSSVMILALAVGIPGGFLLIVLVGMIVIFVVTRSRKPKPRQRQDPTPRF